MDMGQAKKLMQIQQQALSVNKKLENIEIEAEANGLVIIFDARMNCLRSELEDKTLLSDEKKLLEAIKTCVNKGIKKSQEIAAQEMQGIMGTLGLDLGTMGMGNN